MRTAGNTLVASYEYHVRADGLRDTVDEKQKNVDGSTTETFITYTYDNDGRLTSETHDVGNNGPDAADEKITYDFDLANNRTTKVCQSPRPAFGQNGFGANHPRGYWCHLAAPRQGRSPSVGRCSRAKIQDVVMDVFVDTNVLLDVLVQREPFYADSAAVWTLAEHGKNPWDDFGGEFYQNLLHRSSAA